MDVLELLLNANPTNLPEKEVKLKRLSKECGGDIIFRLKALTYNTVSDIQKTHIDDMDVHIILSGVTSPNLKSEELKKKYNAVTPADLIKNMLLPGEIEDLKREIERLSGYRVNTLENIKKK